MKKRIGKKPTQNTEVFSEHIKTVEQFGSVLRRMRKHRGLSQTELAKRAGLRQPTISDIEGGGGNLESVFRIIQALNVNLAASSNTVRDPRAGQKSLARQVLDLLED